jgi:hypothetical protein
MASSLPASAGCVQPSSLAGTEIPVSVVDLDAVASDRRSLSALIKKLLTDHCEAEGFLGERRERKPSKPRRRGRQTRTP